MRIDGKKRVMWLLNHTTARKFEVSMLLNQGFEVFTPKIFPSELSFRTASVDFSTDSSLTVPRGDLAKLNEINWYKLPNQEAWNLANKYFDIIFFIFYKAAWLEEVCRKFQGATVLRVYGRTQDFTYSEILDQYTEYSAKRNILKLGEKFWFGEAYSHLHEVERNYLKRRAVFLPLGLDLSGSSARWTGEVPEIFFVCPDIEVHDVYRNYYQTFLREFDGLPYKIGGTQGVRVSDRNVLGYVEKAKHLENMRKFRVMFYHSREPNHIHFHPFEAINVGMPLVFMSGGLLDKFGGESQPGRCKSYAEARRKIRRILNGDTRLIESIQANQISLLEPMREENCVSAWRDGLNLIFQSANASSWIESNFQRRKIAIIVTEIPSRAALRISNLIVELLNNSGEITGDSLEVSLFLPEGAFDNHFSLSIKRFPGLNVRPYCWKNYDHAAAARSMHYAGFDGWKPSGETYVWPDDGIQQLSEFVLCIFVGPLLTRRLLPISRPIYFQTDSLERLYRCGQKDEIVAATENLRNSKHVLSSSKFLLSELRNISDSDKFRSLFSINALLIEHFAEELPADSGSESIVWPLHDLTSEKLEKWTDLFISALDIYYHEHGGKLNCCCLVPVGCNFREQSDRIQKAIEADRKMRRKIRFNVPTSERGYQRILMHSKLILDTADPFRVNLTPLEACAKDIPYLAIKHPQLEELNRKLKVGLNLIGEDCSPAELAMKISSLEQTPKSGSRKCCSESSIKDACAHEFWEEISKCL